MDRIHIIDQVILCAGIADYFTFSITNWDSALVVAITATGKGGRDLGCFLGGNPNCRHLSKNQAQHQQDTYDSFFHNKFLL